MDFVLGVDAAWTVTQASGMALIEATPRGWSLLKAACSYAAYTDDPSASHSLQPLQIVQATRSLCGFAPTLIAVDMPLSRSRIVGRRASDDAVSRAYGARHCSTHTPSLVRPGQISDNLTADFAELGFGLATNLVTKPALIEVYPHPALVELARAERRLPYKVAKVRSYWPEFSPVDRRKALVELWRDIIGLLDKRIEGVAQALPLPEQGATGRNLKAFEDTLDAVICAWVGACVIEGKAEPYGDGDSAIWIPKSDAIH
jgi:predicted RNase H-like nuclease